MASRNPNFTQLQASYLFVDIANRKKAFLEKHPDAHLISLGIGDTTEPLPASVTSGMSDRIQRLGTVEGYTGYPDYNGDEFLRKCISERFYNGKVSADEIFISDGSKPDLARLQFLFDSNCTIAVQDPVYPAYVDASVIAGKAGTAAAGGRYSKVVYLPCNPSNDFFPDLEKTPRTDLIFFCSPNNPTGAACTRSQLERLVAFAKKNKSIIIYDAAYSAFARDANVPKSIFEIEGSREVALETSSFSKIVGFTGVRLGWTACPKDLKFQCGAPVISDWSRIAGTMFNGPSNVAESGGIGALSEKGQEATKALVNFYMNNARIIKMGMQAAGFECYGGTNAPYIWIKVPSDSWSMFQELLEGPHIVTTPGVGFGREGEGFIRMSAFAHREDVEEAMRRITKHFSASKENTH